jgi:predicted P-loop ATPase
MSSRFNETKLPIQSSDRVQLVKDFLDQHYEIKINVFDTSKSFIVAKDKKLYKSEPSLNDISLHMESEGVKGCDSILKKIINSPNQVTTFNPIIDYINSLAGVWKGESHIDKLCQHIQARDFGDKTASYYQDRFKTILKKWLAASIACALGERQNDVMIGFVHADEGIGKTFALEFLVPKELKAYYIKSDKEDRFFNITTAFTRNFMVNFDEFVGITKSTADTLKKVISSTEITINKTFTVSIPRIGNGVFTSNKTKELGGFLTPEMGYRRFAVIELDSIAHGYSIEVNIDQLWAEAYMLYKNADFDFVWNVEDFEEFRTYNVNYLIETTAFKLIKEYYRLPELDEETVFKLPMDILQDLRKARKLTNAMTNVSDVTIGMALKSLGFIKHGNRINKLQTRYGYNVIQLFE